MKKLGTKVLSVILVFSLIFGSAASVCSVAAADIGNTLENAGLAVVEVIFTTLVGAINAIVPDSKNFVKVKDRVVENFYEGTGEWKDEAAPNAQWKLGHSNASFVSQSEGTRDAFEWPSFH